MSSFNGCVEYVVRMKVRVVSWECYVNYFRFMKPYNKNWYLMNEYYLSEDFIFFLK